MRFNISKREKFIVSALVLSLGLWAIQLSGPTWRYQAIGLLSVLTYFLAAWSLSEGLAGIEWLTVLTLPALFTASVGLFFFLVLAHWWARLPVVIIYGFGIYILLLIENIFSVAAIRTIQLLRSAQAVGFLLTLTTAFFLYDTVLSFRFSPWSNNLAVALVSFPLVLPALWCINLEEKITRPILLYTLVLSLIQGEIALVFSFWPLNVAVGSLVLVTMLYIILALIQHQLSERLFKRTVREYLGIGLVVLIVILLTTHWGG